MPNEDPPPRLSWSTNFQIWAWLVLGGFGGAMVIGTNEQQDVAIAQIKEKLDSIERTQGEMCEVLGCVKQGIRR